MTLMLKEDVGKMTNQALIELKKSLQTAITKIDKEILKRAEKLQPK